MSHYSLIKKNGAYRKRRVTWCSSAASRKENVYKAYRLLTILYRTKKKLRGKNRLRARYFCPEDSLLRSQWVVRGATTKWPGQQRLLGAELRSHYLQKRACYTRGLGKAAVIVGRIRSSVLYFAVHTAIARHVLLGIKLSSSNARAATRLIP